MFGCSSSKVADRKSTRLNSSHSQISYAVFWFQKNIHTLFESDFFKIKTGNATVHVDNQGIGKQRGVDSRRLKRDKNLQNILFCEITNAQSNPHPPPLSGAAK